MSPMRTMRWKPAGLACAFGLSIGAAAHATLINVTGLGAPGLIERDRLIETALTTPSESLIDFDTQTLTTYRVPLSEAPRASWNLHPEPSPTDSMLLGTQPRDVTGVLTF